MPAYDKANIHKRPIMHKISNKQKRIESLISINNTLNTQLTGIGKDAMKCTCSKNTILKLREEIKSLLKLDGVFPLSEKGE